MAAAFIAVTPQWVSASQIPATFGISEKSVKRAIAAGQPIKCRLFGNKHIYEVESINEWLNSLGEE